MGKELKKTKRKKMAFGISGLFSPFLLLLCSFSPSSFLSILRTKANAEPRSEPLALTWVNGNGYVDFPFRAIR
ncbi:hypothetical protein VNO77_18296 [Canavalia gladiata]|uniref:Uncharacterized protein n=1 Tax=Canavalia gladiata TaxID=3824 RepID=A0AAN9LKJ2_CANGL